MFTFFVKHTFFKCSLANVAKSFKHEGYNNIENYIQIMLLNACQNRKAISCQNTTMGRISCNHPKKTDKTICGNHICWIIFNLFWFVSLPNKRFNARFYAHKVGFQIFFCVIYKGPCGITPCFQTGSLEKPIRGSAYDVVDLAGYIRLRRYDEEPCGWDPHPLQGTACEAPNKPTAGGESWKVWKLETLKKPIWNGWKWDRKSVV